MDFLEDDFLILINRMVGIRPQPSSSLPTKKIVSKIFQCWKRQERRWSNFGLFLYNPSSGAR